MRTSALLALSLLLATGAVAHEAHHGGLRLIHPHVPPVEEGKTTQLMLTISNDGVADQLLGVETEIGTVKLQPVQIPAKAKTIQVRAVLLGARRTYVDSEMVPATFVFAKAGRVSEEIMIER